MELGAYLHVCMTFLVCVLCQPVHLCIEPSLHGVDFFLEIILWRLVSVHFLLTFITRYRPRYVDASSEHVCIVTNGVQQPGSTLCPLSECSHKLF